MYYATSQARRVRRIIRYISSGLSCICKCYLYLYLHRYLVLVKQRGNESSGPGRRCGLYARLAQHNIQRTVRMTQTACERQSKRQIDKDRLQNSLKDHLEDNLKGEVPAVKNAVTARAARTSTGLTQYLSNKRTVNDKKQQGARSTSVCRQRISGRSEIEKNDQATSHTLRDEKENHKTSQTKVD